MTDVSVECYGRLFHLLMRFLEMGTKLIEKYGRKVIGYMRQGRNKTKFAATKRMESFMTSSEYVFD